MAADQRIEAERVEIPSSIKVGQNVSFNVVAALPYQRPASLHRPPSPPFSPPAVLIKFIKKFIRQHYFDVHQLV